MTQKNYLIISLLSLLVGIIFFAFQKEYLILNFEKTNINNEQSTSNKKTIPLFFWKSHEWRCERIPLLLDNNTDLCMQQIIGHWLQLLLHEKIMKKKIIIEAILISYDQKELFISWDHKLWSKEQSMFEKWMLIEGLLKTLRAQDTSIQRVYFFKHHKPINDYHLDFTNPWPIVGFN